MNDSYATFRPALDAALRAALEYLGRLSDGAVGPSVDVPTLQARLGKPLEGAGRAPEDVIRELVADVDGGLMGSAGGRFFAWVIGGSLPAALAADWLTSVWDQNAALTTCSPAAAVVEETAGAWLKDVLRLPAEASFAFVTGC